MSRIRGGDFRVRDHPAIADMEVNPVVRRLEGRHSVVSGKREQPVLARSGPLATQFDPSVAVTQGVNASPDAISCLQHDDPGTPGSQVASCGQPRKPGTHDYSVDDLHLPRLSEP